MSIRTTLIQAIFTASVLGIAVPVTLNAEDIPPTGPLSFTTYDSNGDGIVSEDEFSSVREARQAAQASDERPMANAASAPAFSDFDANKDGQLSSDEFSARQATRMQERQSQRQTQNKYQKKNQYKYQSQNSDGTGQMQMNRGAVRGGGMGQGRQ